MPSFHKNNTKIKVLPFLIHILRKKQPSSMDCRKLVFQARGVSHTGYIARRKLDTRIVKYKEIWRKRTWKRRGFTNVEVLTNILHEETNMSQETRTRHDIS